mgnify:CR=1 FL=1
MIAKEVPTDKCIKYVLSKFKYSKIKNKNGTVISPPPIPNKPAKKPAIAAIGTIKIIRKIYWFEKISLINLASGLGYMI